MRSAGDIKRELIRLHWTVKLPWKDISDKSGVSVKSLMAAIRLEAGEMIQRRLDAYLDAKKLHVPQGHSKRLSEIERMTYELWKEYKQKSIPMNWVYSMPAERQERLRVAMHWRLKRLLRERIAKELGKEPYFPDGASYWNLKSKILAWGEIKPAYRESYRRKRQGSVA